MNMKYKLEITGTNGSKSVIRISKIWSKSKYVTCKNINLHVKYLKRY